MRENTCTLKRRAPSPPLEAPEKLKLAVGAVSTCLEAVGTVKVTGFCHQPRLLILLQVQLDKHSPVPISMSEQPSNYQRIYAVVSLIPRGKVATYGEIADLAGLPRRARLVGYALSALTDRAIPWHRVVNARGEISPRSGGSDSHHLQRLRLEREGVVFDAQGRIDLERYRWRPRPE